jgi:hypothetical protein
MLENGKCAVCFKTRHPDDFDDHGGRALRDPHRRRPNASSRNEKNCAGGDD